MDKKTVKRIFNTISTFSEIHNKQVAPLLTEHEREINDIQEDIKALYELVEMYFFVFSKAMFVGFFDEKENVEQLLEGLNEMQDYYLCCVSVVNFVSSLQETSDKDFEKDEEPS